jgi:translation initiation factor 1 (eIF-1/SUI1)
MPELTAILVAKVEEDKQNKKFMAAVQGIDIDKGSSEDPQKKWEDLKTRAFSGGRVTDSNDIASLQGETAKQKGFGIGRGLEYTNGNKVKNPFG